MNEHTIDCADQRGLTVVSTHRTSEGLVVWTRDQDGHLGATLYSPADTTHPALITRAHRSA